MTLKRAAIAGMVAFTLLAGCGSSAKTTSKTTTTRAADPSAKAIAACRTAATGVLSSPATAKFQKPVAYGPASSGYTVSGTVDSDHTGGGNQRDAWVCVSDLKGKAVAVDLGLWTQAPKVTAPVLMTADCIADGDVNSLAYLAPKCDTPIQFALAISATGHPQTYSDVLSILPDLCTTTSDTGRSATICNNLPNN